MRSRFQLSRHFRRIGVSVRITVLLSTLICSGCVATKYKPAPKGLPPAVMLNLAAADAPIEAVLHSVIVYHGPGSWKRDAYWDEYVVSIANHGDVPFMLDEATLQDFQGATNRPGDDPWALEKQSKTWWQNAKSSQASELLKLGSGTVGLGAGLLAFAALGSGPILGPATGASAAFAGAAVAVVAVAPIYAVTLVVINSNNKKHIAAEFTHRRLVFPATIAPHQTGQGSLFFRLSPGPQRLALRGRIGEAPIEVTIDLTPLKTLHLRALPEGVNLASSDARASSRETANLRYPVARPTASIVLDSSPSLRMTNRE